MSLLLLFKGGTPDAGGGVLRSYTVGNSGTADIVVGTLTLEPDTGDIAAFSLVSDGVSGATIGPGESRSFQVRFLPTVAGSYLASVRIPSSDNDGALTVALIGEAVEEEDLVAGIAVDPLSWDYGSIDTATGSAVKVFTVSSTGTGPLLPGTVAIGGAGATSYAKSADGVSGLSIPAGESRTVTVTFNPTTDGTKVGTLTFPSDAGASIVVPLTGVGTTGAPAPVPYLIARFYLSRRATPVAAIAASGWDAHTVDADNLLGTVKAGPAVSWGTTTNHSGVNGGAVRLGRWISPPLAAQTVTDETFNCYAVGYRSNALGSNVTSALRFGVWRVASGLVDWQTVLSYASAGASAWPNSVTPLPRRFPRGDPFSWVVDLDFLANDRLVVELGFRAFTSSAGSARIRWGGASTGVDLANTQDEQDIDLVPWLDFGNGLLVAP